jgi:hypothetical protein
VGRGRTFLAGFPERHRCASRFARPQRRTDGCPCRNADLHDHRLFEASKLILQEKASCFPATALLSLPLAAWPTAEAVASVGGAPVTGATHSCVWPAWPTAAAQAASAAGLPAPPIHVIDCCAAPGNKTLQTAAVRHQPMHIDTVAAGFFVGLKLRHDRCSRMRSAVD